MFGYAPASPRPNTKRTPIIDAQQNAGRGIGDKPANNPIRGTGQRREDRPDHDDAKNDGARSPRIAEPTAGDFHESVADDERQEDEAHSFVGAGVFEFCARLGVVLLSLRAQFRFILIRELVEMQVARNVVLHLHDADAIEVSKEREGTEGGEYQMADACRSLVAKGKAHENARQPGKHAWRVGWKGRSRFGQNREFTRPHG